MSINPKDPAQPLARRIGEQRWLPYRIRRSIMKRLAPGFLKDHAFECEMEDGIRFQGNVVNYIDRIIYFCGLHEKYMLYLLRDILPELKKLRGDTVTFMDVGANAGNHSLFLSPKLDNIYAFEPSPKVRDQLNNNIALNGFTNIRVFDVGLGKENAALPFYTGPEENLGAASFASNHYEGNELLGELNVCIGDEVVEEEQLGRIDIIKADVEGFEPDVLAGLRQTIGRDRPLIIIELSATTKKTWPTKDVLAADLPENYQFYAFAKGSNDTGAYALESYDDSKHYKIEDVICVPSECCAPLGFAPQD